MASKLYGVYATIIIFLFVFYCTITNDKIIIKNNNIIKSPLVTSVHHHNHQMYPNHYKKNDHSCYEWLIFKLKVSTFLYYFNKTIFALLLISYSNVSATNTGITKESK